MAQPTFILVKLAIARGRRRWWGACTTLSRLAVRNYTEEGIANLVSSGSGCTCWLQMYRLVCYRYDMKILWRIFSGGGNNVYGACGGSLGICSAEGGGRG